MLASLGAGGITADVLNSAASRMLFDLSRGGRSSWDPDFKDPLHIANAIFVDYTYNLQNDFAQTYLDFYRGELMSVNFSHPDAVGIVNRWASDNTQGMINNLIDRFDPDTVAAIANAIFFTDKWATQFHVNDTHKGTFHSATGEKTVDFMERTDSNFMYYEDGNLQAVTLEFAAGGGMTVFLPKNGDANSLLANMTEREFDRILDNMVNLNNGIHIENERRTVHLRFSMPKFKIETKLNNLWGALNVLGVPLVNSRLDPITGLVYDSSPLFISDAVQMAMIDVDEYGATAAAVTVMSVVPTSMPADPVLFEMVCDRPFAFVLHQPTVDGGQQVLFMGVVNQ
jgi:serpin B